MRMSALPLPQLCLITDPGIPDLQQAVEEAISAGVTMVQVRGPQLTGAQLYRLVQPLLALCRRAGVLCIVNDRLDVGLAAGVDGFQLGVRSLPLAVARRVVGEEYLLGVSVHSIEEARAALEEGADFLLAGTIFPSRSHPAEPPQGLELLREIKRAFPTCHLLAVGGITAANAEQVRAAGADGVAVISAILGAADRVQATAALRDALCLPAQSGKRQERQP